jgi:hypothetical protein
MDRPPKPAPFKVGTRLRYRGTTESYTYDIDAKTGERKMVPLLVPGMEVVISEAKPGYQGTLRHLRDSDGPLYYEDTGEPILDTTRDGYSVYHVHAWQGGVQQGRVIDRTNAQEWERIK